MRVLQIIVLILLAIDINAQELKRFPQKRCPIRTINYETGLLNNATTDIITDALGFTWISTRTGLQRFNGYTLETITPVAGRDTFQINYPVYFFGLKNGTIWISIREGILEYDPGTDAFRHIISHAPKKDPGFNIVPAKEDGENVWCFELSKGVTVYNRNGRLVEQLTVADADEIVEILQARDFHFRDIIAETNDNVFIGSPKGRILYLNTKTRELKRLETGDSNILALAAKEDNLYVSTDRHFLHINAISHRVEGKIKSRVILDEEIVTSAICADRDQLLVSFNNHLFEFDFLADTKEITDLKRNTVVATGYIFKIFTDNAKRIWLSSNNDVKRIQNFEIPFAHFIYPQAPNNFVRALYYDKEKNLLLAGCLNGGIQLYDTLSNPLWERPLITNDVKDVIAIEKLTDHEYLVVTFGRGWHLLDLRQGKLRPFILPYGMEQELRTRQPNFGNNIQRIDENTLLVSTSVNVFRCSFSGSKLQSAEPLLQVKSNYINCFTFSPNKTLWAGTHMGLVYRLAENGMLQTLTIPGNYGVRSIATDIKSNTWVGTDKGIFLFSADGKLIRTISRESGLLNDCIYGLLPVDGQASVFASSNMGISYVPLDGAVQNFSRETGLQENEFNTGSCMKTSAGKFYFGGVNGITAFYPAALSIMEDSPVLHISRLVVNDSMFNSSAGIWKGDTIFLKHNQNHLRIDLAAVGLLNANEYLYKYRLVGFEESWQTTYRPIGINYILEPGTYTLEVVYNPVFSPERSFRKNILIVIDPPWWQTWWFRLLAGIAAIAIPAFVIHQYNKRRFLKKIHALQMQQQIQIERERISRDLHDNLGAQANAILYGTEQLGQQTESLLANNLHITAKQMLQNLRETVWAMKHPDLHASEIWLRVINFCKQLSVFYKDTKILTKGEAPAGLVFTSATALHIVLIIQEAVNNAVHHAGAKSITVHSEVKGHSWTLKIEDDGSGFDQLSVKNKSGGFGLGNMKERTKMMNAILTMNTDPERGTTIILQVPVPQLTEP